MVGIKRDLEQRIFYTKDLRSFLTVLDVELRFLHRKLHRDIRLVKERSAIVRFKVSRRGCVFPCMDDDSVDTSK